VPITTELLYLLRTLLFSPSTNLPTFKLTMLKTIQHKSIFTQASRSFKTHNTVPFQAVVLLPSRRSLSNSAKMSAPGADHEPRQTTTTGDYTPNPANSIKVPESRQRLVQDITDLYSCKPTHAKVSRYTPDAVYDDMYGLFPLLFLFLIFF